MAGKEERLDPGPVVWGGVEFVHVRHPETGGEADVPAHLVEHHRQRGWEPTAPPPAEPTVVEKPIAAEKPTQPKRQPAPKTPTQEN